MGRKEPLDGSCFRIIDLNSVICCGVIFRVTACLVSHESAPEYFSFWMLRNELEIGWKAEKKSTFGDYFAFSGYPPLVRRKI